MSAPPKRQWWEMTTAQRRVLQEVDARHALAYDDYVDDVLCLTPAEHPWTEIARTMRKSKRWWRIPACEGWSRGEVASYDDVYDVLFRFADEVSGEIPWR